MSATHEGWRRAIARRSGATRPLVAAIVVLASLALPARAGLPKAAIDAVGVSAPPAAHVPTDAIVIDEAGQHRSLAGVLGGRPTVLIFADFTCTTLCGPALDLTLAALTQTRLTPVRDFQVAVIGLDPKDGAADAAAMRAAHMGDAPATAVAFLRADSATIGRLTGAVGYHYAYDRDNDQFAHPAAAFVLTADGHVARALSVMGMTSQDLGLAVMEAGEGRIGAMVDHVRLLCYGFDPVAGVYTLAVGRVLAGTAAVSVLLLGGLITTMILVSRRRARRG